MRRVLLSGVLFVVWGLGFQSYVVASDDRIVQPDPETFIREIVLFFNGSSAEDPRISAVAEKSLKSNRWEVTQEIPCGSVPKKLKTDSYGTVRARVSMRCWVEIARYINRNKGMDIYRRVTTLRDVCLWAVSGHAGIVYFCYTDGDFVIYVGETPCWSDKADLLVCGCLANTLYGNNLQKFCATIAECDKRHPFFIDTVLGDVSTIALRTAMRLPTAATPSSWHTPASISGRVQKEPEAATFAAVASPKRSCDGSTDRGVVIRLTKPVPPSVWSEGCPKADFLVSAPRPQRKRGGRDRHRPAAVLVPDESTQRIKPDSLEDILRDAGAGVTITSDELFLLAAGQTITLKEIKTVLADSASKHGEDALNDPNCALYYRPRDKTLLVLSSSPRDATLVRLLGNSMRARRKPMWRLHKYLTKDE